MTETNETVTELVRQFEAIYVDHMRDLPIVNACLKVEAVGFQQYESHQLGVLITPWFMNLVLLPGNDEWAENAQGDLTSIDFPSGAIDFTTSRDDVLGTYLTAVLFRSVSDIPDQRMARALALQVLQDLFVPAHSERSVSRRALLTGLRST
ncbi:MAG: [NiFe]-hydrogenase assembly chaperone HybE [Woeseiaceae bacterium]